MVKAVSCLLTISCFLLNQSTNAQWQLNGTNAYYNGGNVGIGRTDPSHSLDIATNRANDGLRIDHNQHSFVTLHSSSLGGGSWNGITQAGDAGIIYGGATKVGDAQVNFGFVIAPWYHGTAGLRMDLNGNVSLGTHDAKGYKLAVNGNAIFTSIKVRAVANWADYVFEPTYRLRPLSEVEAYIQQNHHLPEVPSAEEVKANGICVEENQALLLKKIEELTLYMIEQQKEIATLRSTVDALQKPATKRRANRGQ